MGRSEPSRQRKDLCYWTYRTWLPVLARARRAAVIGSQGDGSRKEHELGQWERSDDPEALLVFVRAVGGCANTLPGWLWANWKFKCYNRDGAGAAVVKVRKPEAHRSESVKMDTRHSRTACSVKHWARGWWKRVVLLKEKRHNSWHDHPRGLVWRDCSNEPGNLAGIEVLQGIKNLASWHG